MTRYAPTTGNLCGLPCPAPAGPCVSCKTGDCGYDGALPPVGGPKPYQVRVSFPGGGLMLFGMGGHSRVTAWTDAAELLMQLRVRRPGEIQVGRIIDRPNRRRWQRWQCAVPAVPRDGS